jgi:acyl-CoA synthetase (NDP forming)
VERLLNPSSVAVVGASDRPETYSSETLRNLQRLGFEGTVWGVNPGRASAHGVPCFPSLADLPGVPDAVVIAIAAAGVPAIVEQAGALGCGGAVVFAAGFGETADGAALEDELREAAARHALPVCGPNCDGLISLHSRAALWGDALAAPEPGHVALVSQSGNLVVNALATRRGLRLHTAISSGNETVLTTPDYLEHLACDPGVRSIALLVEAAGDGARLCEALAVCADEGVGVAVLKVGASAVGAAAAAAHTGAVAGDHRVFRALVEEAGAAWAADVHDLLELAKALAVRSARPRGGGLAILTCSGGDSGLGADEAVRAGLTLPPLAAATAVALRELLPATATVANPLDYTVLIWGEVETLRDIVRVVGDDSDVGHVLVFYDRPPGISGPVAESWDAVEEGIRAGAAVSAVPVMTAATLPELLDDGAAWRFISAGVVAVAGLRTGVAVAAALAAPAADGARLRSIAAACRAAARGDGRWLAEHEAKALLRARGVPVVGGRLASNEDEAVAAFQELAGPVALKLSAADVRHKTQIGALALDIRDESGVREAFRQLAGVAESRIPRLNNPATGNSAAHASLNAQLDPVAPILVEQMAQPAAELLVAVRTDAVVPALVVGLGGVWTEALDDVAIVPLPASAERVERALSSLKGAALIPNVAAAAHVAAQIGAAANGLELLECNPVLVHRDGAVVVDATAKEVTS